MPMRDAFGPFLAAAWLAFAPATFAQQPAYNLAVPAPAGSDWDRAARALGTALAEVKATSGMTVSNAPGAATASVADFVKRTRGDPRELLLAGQDFVAAAELDAAALRLQEATPVARLATGHFAVFVPAGSPFASMADLARAFKSDPAAIAWDAGAPGSTTHLLVAFLARAVGADAARIRLAPASGGSAAHAGVGKLRDVSAAVKAGRVRALAVTAPAATAGIASLKEQGINVVFGNWVGLFAAPGLRPSQRDDLLARVKAATDTPAWKALLAAEGWTPVWLQGADYARFLDEESRSLNYLARSIGLQPRR
jgi:putative tricarboxylic transport membrane protein